MICLARALLRHRHQFQQVAVRIVEIDAAAAAPIVELTIIEAPRRAAVGDLGFFDTRENRVELSVADVKSIVMTLELPICVEQQCQILVDLDRGEITGATALEAEYAGEEFRRRDLVARWDDGVIERDGHRCRLPPFARKSDTDARPGRRRGRSRLSPARICR